MSRKPDWSNVEDLGEFESRTEVQLMGRVGERATFEWFVSVDSHADPGRSKFYFEGVASGATYRQGLELAKLQAGAAEQMAALFVESAGGSLFVETERRALTVRA